MARRVAAQAQGDLLALERVVNEQTGKLYTVIRVDDVRRTVSFFGSTAGEGGWRIAIVDAVDDLQREGANALLKVLEEPPARAILLLVSHAPGRELPTIRSRCRRLLLRPLGESDVAQAVAAATGRDAGEADVQEAARAADGSVGRALSLLDENARSLRQRVLDLIAQLPEPDPRALHALGDALGGTDPQTLEAFMDLVNGWLSAQVSGGGGPLPRMARVAETWEKVNRAAARGGDLQSRTQAAGVRGVRRAGGSGARVKRQEFRHVRAPRYVQPRRHGRARRPLQPRGRRRAASSSSPGNCRSRPTAASLAMRRSTSRRAKCWPMWPMHSPPPAPR